MRSVLTTLVPLVWFGGTAWAQTPAPAPSGPSTVGVAQMPAGVSAPVKAGKRARNRRAARRIAVADRKQERPRGPTTVEEALTSCLVLWEPSTHMTKREWTRACRRVAERLRETG
jgi:hypothetical protein